MEHSSGDWYFAHMSLETAGKETHVHALKVETAVKEPLFP